MTHKIRLGPIAVFLVVVTIIITTLAILTLATTNADLVMAQRFAAVTEIRYDLESEGQQFIKDYDEKIAAGAGGIQDADRITTIDKNGYTLEIELSTPDANGDFEILKWKLKKNWNADDPYKHIWKGAE